MQAAELQQKLRAGIEAIRAGERERGRELLLQVVEADERVEPAWLWLAAAVDEPADKLTALENALALNPHNARAREQWEALRQQLGLTPLPAPVEAKAAAQAEAKAPAESSQAAVPPTLPEGFTAIDPDEDPLQCPYCGQLTGEADDRCPYCRRGLLAPGRWQAGIYLYFLLLIFGLNAQAAVVEAIVPFLAEMVQSDADLMRLLSLTPFGSEAMVVPWWAFALRAFGLLILLFLFIDEAPPAYPLGAGVFAVDVLANGLAWLAGWMPNIIAQINMAFSGVLLAITLVALFSQSLARRRMYTQLDREIFDAIGFYRRGREHMRKGRLALAALHFRKAAALQPRMPQFYKDLGLAQARLGRYLKARQTLQEGASRAPDDPEFSKLLAMVDRKAPRPG